MSPKEMWEHAKMRRKKNYKKLVFARFGLIA